MKIVFLGTAGGCATATRNTTAIALEADHRHLLIDCGEGAHRQMLLCDLPVMELESIFFTHLHPDHFFGLPGLLLAMHIGGRQSALNIFGPRGLRTALMSCFEISGFTPALTLQIAELEPGDGWHDELWAISTAEPDHGPLALSYRITACQGNGSDSLLGATVVISGDTRPSPEVEALAAGADLLVHEAMFTDELATLAHEKGHTTFSQAAQLARRAEVSQLCLVHLAASTDRPEVREPALARAREIFPATELPDDGDVVEIEL